jgi:hypothetical protein
MQETPKNTRFVVTVPEDEYETLMEWLPRKGYSLSAFVRMAVREAAKARGLDLPLAVSPRGKRPARPGA